jgi:hypothetical protein
MFAHACERVSVKLYKDIVGQIVAMDNFLVFKKMMLARNKALNEEAIRGIHEEEGLGNDSEAQLQKAHEDKEQAEMEEAIALSLAMEVMNLHIGREKGSIGN